LNQEMLKPIIEAVVREVMKKMEGAAGAAEIKKEESQKEKILLVFTGGTGNLDMVLEQLKLLSEKFDFIALFSKSAEKAVGKQRIREAIEFEDAIEENLYDALSAVDKIIFPTLTQNTAAKAAVGIRDSVASEALACGLLLKKKVIAITDSIPLKSMPAAYARMVGEVLKRVEQLGVDMCKAEELANKVLYIKKDTGIKTVPAGTECKIETAPEPLKPKPPENAQEKQNVLALESKAPVTAEVVNNAILKGFNKIILPPRTILTPLAKDAAKDNKVDVEWAVE